MKRKLLMSLALMLLSSSMVGCVQVVDDGTLPPVKVEEVQSEELTHEELEELYFQTFAESLEESILAGTNSLAAGADAALNAQKAVQLQNANFNPVIDIENLFTKQEQVIKEVYEGVNNRESSRDSD